MCNITKSEKKTAKENIWFEQFISNFPSVFVWIIMNSFDDQGHFARRNGGGLAANSKKISFHSSKCWRLSANWIILAFLHQIGHYGQCLMAIAEHFSKSDCIDGLFLARPIQFNWRKISFFNYLCRNKNKSLIE
jgi:hypothetical protein